MKPGRNIIILVFAIIVLLGLALVLSRRDNPNLVVSGILEADEARIGSRVGGRVALVHTKEGERVTVGQVLVELEPFTLADRLAEARANREQANVMLAKFTTGPRGEELDAARARLEQVKAEQQLAEQSFERQAKLITEKSTSRQLYDEAARSRQAAQARVRELDAEVRDLELGSRKEDIQKAQAEYEAASARVSAMEKELDELSIRAPISGVVSALQLVKGDLVAPTAPVLTIIDDSKFWVRCYVPENALWIRSGAKAMLRFDSLREQTYSGVIGFISPQAEFSPTNVQTFEERARQVFRLKVLVEGETGRLRPGMFADVDFGRKQ